MFQKKPILKVQKEQHDLELVQNHLPALWPVHQQSDQVLSPEMFTSFLDLRVD